MMQRPLGQTPGKTSHSFTSRQQKARRSERWRLPASWLPKGSGYHVVLGEVGRGSASLLGWGIAGKTRIPRREISNDFREGLRQPP